MIAAYLFHRCQNHAFIDGKRVKANAAITFMLMNDWEPLFDEEELELWKQRAPHSKSRLLTRPVQKEFPNRDREGAAHASLRNPALTAAAR
jgi:hypothetical protein